MILKLKAKLATKRAAASKILKAVSDCPETRDMSPDEKTAFDAALADIEVLKTQIAQARDMDEDDEAEEDDDAPAPRPPADEPRSLPTGRRGLPIGQAPAVHHEKRPYSILRALRLATEGRPVDGLEGELSAELAKRTGKTARGFLMPTGADPELRALMDPNRKAEVRTDLTTGTGAGGIFLIPELPLIDLLRAKLVIARMGATILTDMHGTWAIPRQSGQATVYWLAEGSSATASAPTLDQVAFSPKVALAATNISKLFMNQTSVDAETFVKNDLALSMARGIDQVAINGGGSNQPVGILQIAQVGTNSAALQGGTNGGDVTFAQVVNMEAQVAGYNAEGSKMAYLTNPALRGKLKQTPKIGSTFPVFLWSDSGPMAAGMGEVNGYPAYTTTNVPANLTKGTAAGVCSALIFGDFSSLVVAHWEGVDVIVNPYTNQLSGAVTISLEMSVDVKVRHPESFATITDALLT